VVDCLIEIPLPGRAFCASDGAAAHLASSMVMPTFVAGPENRLLASAISRLIPTLQPSSFDSPQLPLAVFAIHGPAGTGKTHLARGLVQTWQEHCGSESAEFFAASDFRHLLIDAIKNKTVAEFRQRVRRRALLVIDDVDHLPRDEYLQQELRSTLDAVEEHSSTLVVTSSHSTSTLRNLSVDVRSRLAAGLSLELTPPDELARTQILRRASAALGRPLSEPAAAKLAAGVGGTAADLFGALFELLADRPTWSAGNAAGRDVRCVEQYLGRRAARRPSLRNILQAVAKYCAIPQKMLKSSSRRQSVVLARSIAVYLSRELTGLSYERIGAGLGGRDHTTMMHSHRKIERRITRDFATREAVDELRRILAVSP
jgi:chromosomal replication initiator protein